MVHSTIIIYCNCSSHWLGNHFLWLQGASRYIRTFDGYRGFLRPYDWNHGAGFT